MIHFTATVFPKWNIYAYRVFDAKGKLLTQGLANTHKEAEQLAENAMYERLKMRQN